MAIPTRYRGVEYRSRLEARWAGFFHRIGWKFTYEPMDGHGYLPDFLVHGPHPMLVEVKPAVLWSDYISPRMVDKITRGLAGVWDGRVLVVGADPLPAIGNVFDTSGTLTAGNFINIGDPSRNAPTDNSPCFSTGVTDKALWTVQGDRVGVCEEIGWYQSSPHADYADHPTAEPGLQQLLEAAWAGAINDVKWRAR